MADGPGAVLTAPLPRVTVPLTTPVDDDPCARNALQRAQGMFQKWPEGFAGFTASVTCTTPRGVAAGTVCVRPDAVPDVRLDDAVAAGFASMALAAIADERTPRFFKDADGRFPVRFEREDHPLGRGISVERPDARVTYRLDGAGRLRVIERETTTLRSVTTLEEVARATPGRVLPARTVTRIVEHGGAPTVETVIDRHVRVEHVWLPAERSVSVVRGDDQRAVVLRFRDHRLVAGSGPARG